MVIGVDYSCPWFSGADDGCLMSTLSES